MSQISYNHTVPSVGDASLIRSCEFYSETIPVKPNAIAAFNRILGVAGVLELYERKRVLCLSRLNVDTSDPSVLVKEILNFASTNIIR